MRHFVVTVTVPIHVAFRDDDATKAEAIRYAQEVALCIDKGAPNPTRARWVHMQSDWRRALIQSVVEKE
jgi:hypothetical protein